MTRRIPQIENWVTWSRRRSAWSCAIRSLAYWYAEMWSLRRGNSHARFKVRIHLRPRTRNMHPFVAEGANP